MSRLPLRVRVTLGFTISMAVLFTVTAVGLYASMSTALLDEVDTGLRFRAATVLAHPERSTGEPSRRLMEPNEAFVQIVSRDGRILATSAQTPAILSSSLLDSITRPRFFVRTFPPAGRMRVLAVPLDRSRVAIVGASLSDRDDALRVLALLLGVGGPFALALASLAGWLLAGAALRPVERMRREAAAISVSGLDRRLSEPDATDELRALAITLNEMLERLADAVQAERRFLDQASHELRTPLSILKTELELALARDRAPEELRAALESAATETDRLAALAEDLLVASRADGGRLSVQREPVVLRDVVASAAERFAARAAAAGVLITIDAAPDEIDIDRVRLQQAVDNLVDNATRHARTRVVLRGSVDGDEALIAVEDDGPGFGASGPSGGLGLRIVRAVARGHGGDIAIGDRDDGGASVRMTLRGVTEPSQRARR